MIRYSTQSDTSALLALSEASGLFPPDHLETLEEILREFFSAGEGQERFWLTDDEGGVVGVVFCEPEMMTNGTWNLRLIAVSPDLQRKGRGAALVHHTEKIVAERGGRLLIVDTSGTDEFASVREFYRQCGYTETTRIPDFFDSGDDKITFIKAIKNGG